MLQLGFKVVAGVVGIHPEIQVPVLLNARLSAAAYGHPAARLQFADTLEQRLLPQAELEGQILRQPVRIQLRIYNPALEQCLDLGRESKTFRVLVIIKWFDPQPVARSKQGALYFVPDHEREHAVQFLHRVRALIHIEPQDHFSVGIGKELGAFLQ